MVAVVNDSPKVDFQVAAEAAVVHQPLVHQAWGLLGATVVMAPTSPFQAPPPHMLGEVGAQAQDPTQRAPGVQGEGAKAVPFLQMLPLVHPTLVVGAGRDLTLEQQGALAL
jgi:hypothetical protein